MLDLERPISSAGEEIRRTMVGTINAIEALPRGDDPYLSDEHATFSADGVKAIQRSLHEKGILPEDVGISGANISVSDLRRGSSDDCVLLGLTVTPDLPELQERRYGGLRTGTYLMLHLSGHSTVFSSLPPYDVGTLHAGDIYDGSYEPELREIVQARFRTINERLEELMHQDSPLVVKLFDVAKEQILAGNATPDRRHYPFKIPWQGLNPDDFPFGLP